MPPCEQLVLLYRMASLADFVQPHSGPESRIFFGMSIGVPARVAGLGAVQDGPWRMAASPVVTMALSNVYWQKQGLRSITERYHQLRGT